MSAPPSRVHLSLTFHDANRLAELCNDDVMTIGEALTMQRNTGRGSFVKELEEMRDSSRRILTAITEAVEHALAIDRARRVLGGGGAS